MNQLLEWLSRFFGEWKCWIVVPPWDIGIRVRLGRNATALAAGFHFRIPLVDDITLVNTRLRTTITAPVTTSNNNGRVGVRTASIGYRITDPLTSILRFQDPTIAVSNFATAALAQGLPHVETLLGLRAMLEGSGVVIEFLALVDDINNARPFRLLQNSGMPYPENGLSGRY